MAKAGECPLGKFGLRGIVHLMTEAVIAVLEFLLNKVGFKEIKATYVSLNPASGKVMEKAGFIELVGEENFQPSISAALDRAEEIIHK